MSQYSRVATWLSLLDGDAQRALIDVARSPAGVQLVHALARHMQVAPPLLSLFDHWAAGTHPAPAPYADSGDTAETVGGEGAEDTHSTELEVLRNVNDNLAAALGACAECWGFDADCPECEGEGEAGRFQPDPDLFNALVAPAVVRVGANRARRLRLVPDSFTADSRG